MEFRENTTLMKQGDMPKAFYILVKGSLLVYRNNTLVSVIKTGGEYIGEISILLNTPHSATVKTETTSTLISIEISKVESFLTHAPEIAISLARRLAERLVSLNKELTLLASNVNKSEVYSEKKSATYVPKQQGSIFNLEKLKSLIVEYPENFAIIEQDNHPRALYILVYGEIEILKDEKVIAIESNPGYYLGDVSVLRHAPANATVKTKKSSRFIEIPAEKVDVFLNHSPEIAISISKGLAQRILLINDSILDMKALEVNTYQKKAPSPETQEAVKKRLVDLLGFDPDAM